MNEEILLLIHRNGSIANFLNGFMIHCPNHPDSYVMSEIDVVKMNFSRYTLRTMYFAEKVFLNVNSTLEEVKKRNISPEMIATTISDSVFFDLDAFIISATVLTAGNINGKCKKYLHESVRQEFKAYIDKKLKDFILPYLNEIRNEIIHINEFGTSIGSITFIQNGNFFLRTNHTVEPDYIKLFTTVLTEISEIIFTVSKLIMIHECELYGYPLKDIDFSNGKASVKISEFVKIVSEK